MNKPATALAKVSSLPSAPVQAAETLKASYQRLAQEANLVTPVSSVDTIMQLHGISFRTVMVDATVDNNGNGSDVYRDRRFCQENERALGGVALQKIAAAAGVQTLQRKRVDDRSHPYYCEIEITVGLRDYDGTWRQVTKAREVDLRDGSPETVKPEWVKENGKNRKSGRTVPLDPTALADKRRHIQSLAETKAYYRALRALLTLKQKYTVSELEKPFVVPKLVPMLDPDDPDQKRALIAMATGHEKDLYGSGTVGQLQELKDVDAKPASALEPPQPTATAEATAAPVTDQAEPEFNEADFEMLDIPDAPPAAVCACPCSCSAEISEQEASIGMRDLGTPRCSECYPARRFNVAKHEGINELDIPKKPGLTVERIAAALKGGGR